MQIQLISITPSQITSITTKVFGFHNHQKFKKKKKELLFHFLFKIRVLTSLIATSSLVWILVPATKTQIKNPKIHNKNARN